MHNGLPTFNRLSVLATTAAFTTRGPETLMNAALNAYENLI